MKQKTVKHILYSPLYIIPILFGVFYNSLMFLYLVLPFSLSLVAYSDEWSELGERVGKWYDGFEK